MSLIHIKPWRNVLENTKMIRIEEFIKFIKITTDSFYVHQYNLNKKRLSIYFQCARLTGSQTLKTTWNYGNPIETVNSQNRSNHIIGFDISFHSMILASKSHSPGKYVWRRVLQTNSSDVFSNLTWTHHWRKCHILGTIHVEWSKKIPYSIIYFRRPQDQSWVYPCPLCKCL